MKNLGYTDFFGNEVTHEQALRKNIIDGLVHIIMDEREISEKAFKSVDEVREEVENKVDNPMLEQVEQFLNENKRMKYICEIIYDDLYNGSNVNEHMNEHLNVYSYKDYISESNKTEAKNTIKNLKKLDKSYKEIAYNYVNDLTSAKNGKIHGLDLHEDLKKKIKEKELPSGFSMGIDKDGYFVHTHRARSKSYENPSKITVKDIRFIDSTG